MGAFCMAAPARRRVFEPSSKRRMRAPLPCSTLRPEPQDCAEVAPAAVWFRALMGHPCRVIRRMRYRTGSARERHNDGAAVFRVKRLEAPRRVIPENGVEDREKLPHHCNEGDLLGSAMGSELVVEGPKRGTAPDGSQSRHV